MAELMLTEAEKAAALWSDLDDAALGKLVKKQMATRTQSAEQMDRTTLFSAALLICCGAAEVNAGKAEFDIEGVTQDGRDFGDWTVVATKKTANRKLTGCAKRHQLQRAVRRETSEEP
jgi:hypothetical protein